MNLEKFTDRARGFLQAAQTIASRLNHQRITPAHVLKALLDDEQGMAAGLIARAGGDAAAARRETEEALAKVPAVSGVAPVPAALDGDRSSVDQAEQLAQKPAIACAVDGCARADLVQHDGQGAHRCGG